jgi:2,4-dienoyl-CoA reductase-like NADH-dependent reductase (Old Yellow Enzyme family)
VPDLTTPTRIGARDVKNRLYRAPVLEVAGNRPDAARILQRELEPGAAAGCGLVFQGASLVTPSGGRSAPGLSRVHDREFVRSLRPAVEAVKQHGALLLMQLGHGALQCMELWHRAYRDAHPDITTLAIDEPPWWFKAVSATQLLDLGTVRVATETELTTLADAFGRAAGFAAEAGYDGVHLAGANASIFQQCWSPVFNRRRDVFGVDRDHFFRLVVASIRRHTPPGFLLTTKVPAETERPFFVRGALTVEDGARICRVAEDLGVDAVAPVRVGVTRDQATARGHFPAIAWSDPRWQEGYRAAFGSDARATLVREANRVAARAIPFKPAWNASFCSAVKNAGVSIPVLCEGGLRSRAQMDALISEGTADLCGMARPFYAEPRVPARLLHDAGARALCESCNNCTIPQVTGAVGVCRTPDIMEARGRLEKQGAYGPR